MQKSESIKELATALAKAQAHMGKAHKDSSNPFFKSKYATLESTWEACRESLTSNGLAVIQLPFSQEGMVGVETILTHSSGEWVSEKVTVEMTKKDAQSMGSAISYLRRYSLAAVTGVVQTDDDGNMASHKSHESTALNATLREPVKPTHQQGLNDVEKETIKNLCTLVGWDSATMKSEFNKLTGKASSSYWEIGDYKKVVGHLEGLLKDNPQTGEMFSS